MRRFPIFIDLRGRRVVVSGAGATAVAERRLMLGAEANIVVFGTEPDAQVRAWATERRLTLVERPVSAEDAKAAALCCSANADEGARAAAVGRAAGALIKIGDNLEISALITQLIADRDPVTVSIDTKRAAPVLARKIEAYVEAMLPARLGALTRIGALTWIRRAVRGRVTAPDGRARRGFWTRFYYQRAARVLEEGEDAACEALEALIADGDSPRKGFVHFVGAGPGDPELLTLKARRLLHEADVVIHDKLVPGAILELARREATIVEVGKTAYGPSWKQADINALIVEQAAAGATVVRLKGGDPVVFGRLDEEVEAVEVAGIGYGIVPGVTSASASAAVIGQSLTRRGRNSAFRILTGHDTDGFAEQDWRDLARPGATAAVYMGIKAATFLRGRMLMHGARADLPVTAIESASRPDQRVFATTLIDLPRALSEAAPTGPVLILIGIAPRAVAATVAAAAAEPRQAL